LSIEATGVVVEVAGRRTVFPQGAIAGGWTESIREHDEVVLQMRSGTVVRAAVAGVREARDVLRAAGVAPDQRAISVRLGVAERTGMRAVLVFLALLLAPISAGLTFGAVMGLGMAARHGSAAFGGAVVLAALAVLAGSALWALVRPLLTTTLHIGTDGVMIE